MLRQGLCRRALADGSGGGVIRTDRRVVALAFLVFFAAVSAAEAHKAYCYAPGTKTGEKLQQDLSIDNTFYVTPVFETDQPEVLLEARYGQAVPGAGLATCITDEDDPDIAKSRQDFIDSSKSGGDEIVDQPMPPE